MVDRAKGRTYVYASTEDRARALARERGLRGARTVGDRSRWYEGLRFQPEDHVIVLDAGPRAVAVLRRMLAKARQPGPSVEWLATYEERRP